jgi:NAD-dependent oxidoreductase involved in siderophore biosynthesis
MKLSARRRLMARRLGNPASMAVSVLRIQPRDTLVVFVRGTICAEQAHQLAQHFRQAAGHERVLVVDNRTGLGVLRGGQ